jgi:hypothetical protein
MTTWLRRIWHLLNRSRRERELVREMNEHRESMHDPSTLRRHASSARILPRRVGMELARRCDAGPCVGVRTLVKSPSFAITATLI